MKRLNYAKRMHGPSGDIMATLFQQTLAPSLAQGFTRSSEAEAVLASYSVRRAFDEAVIVMHDARQLITSMSIASPSVSLTLITFCAMFEFDVLLIDLSRPGAPIVCSLEKAGAAYALDDAVCPMVLWLGQEGQVALVPGLAEIDGEDTWPASILFQAGRLQVATAHPFADESVRLEGIERAIDAVARAMDAVRSTRTSPTSGSSF